MKDVNHNYKEDKDKFPLGSAQKRFLLMSEYFDSTDMYNMSLGIFVNKSVKSEDLRQALLKLARSTEMLSMTMHKYEDKTYQISLNIDEDNFPFKFISLEKGNKDFQVELREHLKDFINVPFNLYGDLLWRFLLIKISDKKYYLYLVMHHSISDAWSFSTFFERLSEIYLNKNDNVKSDSFYLKTFIPAEQQYLQNNEQIQNHKLFWKEYLSEKYLPLNINNQSYKENDTPAGLFCNHLDPNELTKLKDFSSEKSATLYIVLISAYFILLSKLTNNRSLVVGTMTSGRNLIEVPDSIGCFANVIPIINKIDGEMTVEEYISYNRDNIISILEHEALPFQDILESYRSNHNHDHISLFDTLFVVQNSLGKFKGLFGDKRSCLDEREQERSLAEFPMFFLIRESDNGLFVNIQYNKNIFSEDKIVSIHNDYLNILRAFLVGDKLLLKDYLSADTQDSQKIQYHFNNTSINYPKELSSYDLFKNQALNAPNAIAIYYKDQILTYAQLLDKVEQIAGYFWDIGVQPEQFVGVSLERTPDMIATLLACFRINCAYVPIDPTQPPLRIESILKDPAIGYLVHSKETYEKIKQCNIPHIVKVDFSNIESTDFKCPPLESNDLTPRYKLFTSGSTGVPKSITIFESNLLNLFYWSKGAFDPNILNGVLAGSSINFDASLIELFVPLINGGKVILAENVLHYHELEAIDEIRLLAGTPSAVAKLIQQKNLRPSVRAVFMSGEPLPADLVDRLFAHENIDTIINGYGLTELTAYSCVEFIKGNQSAPITIGKPIPNTSVYILNEFGRHAPIGVVGEIYVGGKGLPFADSQINSALNDSYCQEIGQSDPKKLMFKTGDMGYFTSEGKLICLGRIDSQIKIRGYRVELSEVESHIRKYPGISEAIVCLKDHEKLDKVLVSYITTSEGRSIDFAELSSYLSNLLPHYMVPSFFVKLDSMPTNTSGKIERKKLAELPYENKEIDTQKLSSEDIYEEGIIEVWRNILGIKNILSTDSFFLLGGHSLLIPEASLQIKKKFNIEIPLVEFFMNPTIQELATFLRSKEQKSSIDLTHSTIELNKNKTPNTPSSDDTTSCDDAAYDDSDIAIISMAFRLPSDTDSPDKFWEKLYKHKTFVTEIPTHRWNWKEYYDADPRAIDKCVGKWGAFLKNVDLFDPNFFNLSKREAKIMDPQQRLLLEVSWELLELGGYSPTYLTEKNKSVGVFIGASLTDYAQLLNQKGFSKDPYYASGNTLCILANRISYILGLNGPSLTIDTACSSSFTALHYAVQSIRNGEIDKAIVGSCALMLIPDNYVVWSQMGILAQNIDSSAFDANATGFVPGEAIATILIKPLKKAILDGDTILGVIKGTAINHDGRTKVGLSATSPRAQAEVILSACQNAKVDFKNVDYIETHGTGTSLGDSVEVLGLLKAFESTSGNTPMHQCPIGSVKPITGHTGPAAGLISLIKALISFKHKKIPPTHIETPNPTINFSEEPFYVNTEVCNWDESKINTVGISSFGFGGSNAHIIVQNYSNNPGKQDSLDQERLFILSAQTDASLFALVQAYIDFIETSEDTLSIRDLCYTLSVGREHFGNRLAIIVRGKKDLLNKLKVFLESRKSLEESYIYYLNKDHHEQLEIDTFTRRGASESIPFLQQQAYNYVSGQSIVWENLYQNEKVARIALPTTPFNRVRCWYQENERENTPLHTKNYSNISLEIKSKITEKEAEWLNLKEWKPTDSYFNEKHFDKNIGWLIFIDSNGFGGHLANHISNHNPNIIKVYPGSYFSHENDIIQINPENINDYNQLLNFCKDKGFDKIHIVHAWCLSLFSPVIDDLKLGLYSFFHLVKALNDYSFSQISLSAVTNNTQKVLGEDQIFAMHSSAWGFLKSLSIEQKNIDLKLLDFSNKDINKHEETVKAFLNITLGSSIVETAIRNGKVYIPSFISATKLQFKEYPAIKEGGTYLIVGGLGGIGVELALWMKSNFDINIILLGRSKASQESINKLRSVDATIINADINNANEMEKVINDIIDKFKCLYGIFHLAGALNYSPIRHKDINEVKRIIEPKILGTITLSKVTKDIPLDFFVLFSSLSAIINTPGLSDYAAGNYFLNCVSHSIKNCLSISWPGWEMVGMGAKHNLEQINSLNISKETAFSLLETILSLDTSELIVCPLNLLSPPTADFKVHFENGPSRPTNLTQKQSASKDWLTNMIANLTELDKSLIHEHLPFFEMGIDSFLAAQLVYRINLERNLKLSPTIIYEYPNISELSKMIDQHSFASSGIAFGENTSSAYNNLISENSSYQDELRSEYSDKDVAIIGLSCAFSSAHNYEQFWNNLVNQEDSIVEVLDQESSQDSTKGSNKSPFFAGKLNSLLNFDPTFFNISPTEAENICDEQKLLLQLSYEALESSGYTPRDLQSYNTGVFIGAMQKNYSLEDPSPHTLLGNSSAILANRLSYFYNLTGPSSTFDTLCSSSLTALHFAIQSIRSGECTYAFVGGVRLPITPEYLNAARQMNALSLSGKCRSFSADADGFVPGEGGAVLLLKSLINAQKDGDRICAIIRGSAINHGGHGNGLTSPNPKAHQEVIIKSFKDASSISPETISYIETHGTGTILGDPIEFDGLKLAFSDYTASKNYCGLGSLKTNIGHCEPAAGIASITKVILCMQNKLLPATLHLKTINPLIDWKDSPFYFVDKNMTWENVDNLPLRAGISAFGIGGSNAHIILEEAPKIKRMSKKSEEIHQVITLSAHDQKSLDTLARDYEEYLLKCPNTPFKDICYTTNCGRTHLSYRLAIVGEGVSSIQRTLKNYNAGIKDDPLVYHGIANTYEYPKIAFLFTGQGSQYLEMAKALYITEPTFANALDKCDNLLSNQFDIPLHNILFGKESESKEKLEKTQYTQPIVFSVEYALFQLLASWNISPDYVLGHSLGEYVAACVAGALSLENSLEIICYRGRIMQALPNNGAMLSVGCSYEDAVGLIKMFEGKIEISAVNSNLNVTLSGNKDSITELTKVLSQNNINFQQLLVSHAFHSHLMDPILPAFKNFLQKFHFKPLQIPLISNVTGNAFNVGHLLTPDYWCQHTREAVQFSKGLDTLLSLNCKAYIEVGPHPVLINLAKQNLAAKEKNLVYTLKRGEDNNLSIKKLLANLYVSGVDINWSKVNSIHKDKRRTLLPLYPFRSPVFSNEEKMPKQPENTMIDSLQSEILMEINTPQIDDTEILESITDLIAQSLGLPADKIEANKPLIDLGADSLVLSNALVYITNKYNVKITMIQLFEEIPTISEIASYIQHKGVKA